MSPRSLFNVILKVFSLFFIKEIINVMLQIFGAISFYIKNAGFQDGVATFTLYIVILGIYLVITYFLIFKTNLIIDKLELDKGFNEPNFAINITAGQVFMIAILLLSGLILVDEITEFWFQVYNYFQTKSQVQDIGYPKLANLFFPFVKNLSSG